MTEKQREIDSEVLVLEKISDHYKGILTTFLDYFKKEVEIIGDSNLLQEIAIIEDILELKYINNPVPQPVKASTNLTKYQHTPEYELKIKSRTFLLEQEPIVSEKSDTVELCFIMDVTGSMGAYIAMCQQKVAEIVDIVTKDHPQTKIKLAFVAYRDHKDPQQSKVIPFTTKVETLKIEINSIKAGGGQDIPEDICGGLRDALQLKWETPRRLMIIIADAPCHGKMYHDEQDNYPTGDPDGLIPEVLLSQAAAKNIHSFFAQIHSRTDKMTSLWTRHMRENHPAYPFSVFSLASDQDFVSNITDAIMTTAFL